MNLTGGFVQKSFHFSGPLLSGFLLVLCFPRHDLGWLAWIGLVPLLLRLCRSGPTWGFFLAFSCGAVFFPGIFNWMLHIQGYRVHHHVILGVYLSLYFGLFGVGIGIVAKRFGAIPALFTAPFLWVSFEFIRSSVSFMSLPWGFLGHSQYENKLVIQIAAFTGAYGISFLIVLVNGALVSVLGAVPLLKDNRKQNFHNEPSARGRVALVAAAVALTSGTLVYGFLTAQGMKVAQSITVSLIQGNIPQDRKWNPRNAEWIMERYASLSKEASTQQPELINWPETATPGYVLKNLSLLGDLTLLIQGIETYFLIGSSEYPKFAQGPTGSMKGGNTALLFSPKGEVLGQYIKIHLVPFYERIPYEETVRWPTFVVPEGRKTYTLPGNEITLFHLNGKTPFGVLICWETLFPDLFRGCVKKGAQFVANINNEAAFGETTFPYQFLAITVFRAVENRVSIVRAGNTGISCFIDSCGRIYAKLEKNGKDTFVEGFLTNKVFLSEDRTFYTNYGDVFAYLCLSVSFLMIIFSIPRAKRKT